MSTKLSFTTMLVEKDVIGQICLLEENYCSCNSTICRGTLSDRIRDVLRSNNETKLVKMNSIIKGCNSAGNFAGLVIAVIKFMEFHDFQDQLQDFFKYFVACYLKG
jgi:hypothetical protein